MRRTLLLLSVTAAPLFLAAQCSDIFFSEYCEGSSQNKALELYNPTQSTIDLSQYVIKRYSNGSFTASESLTLSGSIPASHTIVVTNGQLDSAGGFGFCDTVLYNLGQLHCTGVYPTPMYYNGDDAITLELLNGTIVDLIGEVGVDPGGAWTDDATANYTDGNGGSWWTANHTLVRKHTVEQGVTANPSPFNVTLEWDSLPNNTWTGLGEHQCDCPTVDGISEFKTQSMVFAPNPMANGRVMIKATDLITAVYVFDAQGRAVFSTVPAYKNGTFILELPDAVPGLYMVQVALDGGARLSRELLVN
ncbi:MAG: lamin tail domain-containing protein [Flavobacteriales bacterium]